MLIGILFYSFMVFSLAMYFSTSCSANIISKMAFIDEFCKEASIDRKLKNKIINALLYNQKKGLFDLKEKN